MEKDVVVQEKDSTKACDTGTQIESSGLGLPEVGEAIPTAPLPFHLRLGHVVDDVIVGDLSIRYPDGALHNVAILAMEPADWLVMAWNLRTATTIENEALLGSLHPLR